MFGGYVSRVFSLTRPSTYTLILGTLVLLWFFSFTFKGIFADFNADDLMNLDYYDRWGGLETLLATLQVVTPFYRPLGGLFYLGFYKTFGLDPLPYRLACFALLLINMALFHRFFRLLSGRNDVAWLGLFLVSFHAWFIELYFSTAAIYELLCVFFYLLGFTTYVKIRSSEQDLGSRQWCLVALFYAAALDAKELAVSLPLFIGLYELIYHPPGSIQGLGKWLLRECQGILVLALATMPYIWIKLTSVSFVENPSYRPRISALVFVHTFQIYLNPFLYLDHVLRSGTSMILLGLLLLVAVVARKRHLLFGWLFLFLSPLPFIFIPHYTVFFFYLPSIGWALWAAGLLAMLKDRISIAVVGRMTPGSLTHLKSQALAWSILVIPLAPCLAVGHYHERDKTLRAFLNTQVPVSPLLAGLRDICPDVSTGSILWFRRDPFPKDRFTVDEAIHLICQRRDARVVRGGEEPKGRILGLEYDGRRLRVFETKRQP